MITLVKTVRKMRFKYEQLGPYCSCRGPFLCFWCLYFPSHCHHHSHHPHHSQHHHKVRECVPIKCMEAVVLAIYLTNGIPGLGRSRLITIDNDDADDDNCSGSQSTSSLRWRRLRCSVEGSSFITLSWALLIKVLKIMVMIQFILCW